METQEKKDSMVFYRSFYEALKTLPDDVKAEVYDAIFSFGLDFLEPVFNNSISEAMFRLIKPQIEANNKRYFNGKKPKNKQNTSENKQNISKDEANVNVNDNDNDNVNDNVLLKKVTKPKISLEQRKVDFKISLVTLMETDNIDKQTAKEFYEYWTEPNQNKTKLRFEMEKTWDLNRRMSTWIKNKEKFNSSPNKIATRKEMQDAVKVEFAKKIMNNI